MARKKQTAGKISKKISEKNPTRFSRIERGFRITEFHRRMIVEMRKNKKGTTAIARCLGVARSTVALWSRRGNTTVKVSPGRPRSVLTPQALTTISDHLHEMQNATTYRDLASRLALKNSSIPKRDKREKSWAFAA